MLIGFVTLFGLSNTGSAFLECINSVSTLFAELYNMKTGQFIINGNKLTVHLVFCVVVLAGLVLGMYFLQATGFIFHSLVSAYADCLFFVFCIYTGRWLCKQLYLSGKLVLFLFFTLLAGIGLAILKWCMVRYIFDHPYAGFLEVLRDTMPFFWSALVMGILLKLIRTSMQKELYDANAKAEQKESEFGLLQSQLSPHFLFNVLNNLYGISIAEHKRIPQLLLKLSNLLRYSVYGAKKQFVPVKEELEYVQNYIEFEQIRISDRLVLSTELEEIANHNIKIAPLVLIVFIENAFKHSKNTFNQAVSIDISLKISGNFICFEVSNSCAEEKSADEVLNESSGLGLANTIKRLDLLYGTDYELRQTAANGLYNIGLRLKIKED